ncbi:MAG: glycosyltransferase [Desulfamplus sp.]|nr:glycosyltransferase [Desulfamplus sp.]
MDRIFFLNLDISEKIAGVELSALSRTNLFSQHLDIEPIFLTTNYNWMLHRNKQKIQSNHRASPAMDILNMYDYFQDAVSLNQGEKKVMAEDLKPFRIISVPGTSDVRLYDEKGELVAYCKRHADNLSVNYINFIKDGRVWRRETFDSRGFLSKVDLLEKHGDIETSHDIFFRPDGSMAITKYGSIKNGFATTLSIQLINRENRLTHQFSNDGELRAFWLEIVARENDNSIFVVDRCLEFYEPIKIAIRKTATKSKIVPVIHSVHTAGDILSGVVNKFYKTVLEDIKTPDAIVVFTEEQKKDIIQRFGSGNIHVIPHSYKSIEKNPPLDKRNRFKIVYLARYTFEKKHEFAIEAFRLVVDKIPNAELHLYGFGEKKEEIIKKIKESSLEKNVFVNDFVHEIGNIYQEAGLSILTSSIEAFCMSVMESLFYGCPVVSFDIKYGPNTMIKHGINGYLIPPNNVELFAKQIIYILKNKDLHKNLVNNAANSMQNFTHEAVAEKWKLLL